MKFGDFFRKYSRKIWIYFSIISVLIYSGYFGIYSTNPIYYDNVITELGSKKIFHINAFNSLTYIFYMMGVVTTYSILTTIFFLITDIIYNKPFRNFLNSEKKQISLWGFEFSVEILPTLIMVVGPILSFFFLPVVKNYTPIIFFPVFMTFLPVVYKKIIIKREIHMKKPVLYGTIIEIGLMAIGFQLIFPFPYNIIFFIICATLIPLIIVRRTMKNYRLEITHKIIREGTVFGLSMGITSLVISIFVPFPFYYVASIVNVVIQYKIMRKWAKIFVEEFNVTVPINARFDYSNNKPI